MKPEVLIGFDPAANPDDWVMQVQTEDGNWVVVQGMFGGTLTPAPESEGAQIKAAGKAWIDGIIAAFDEAVEDARERSLRRIAEAPKYPGSSSGFEKRGRRR